MEGAAGTTLCCAGCLVGRHKLYLTTDPNGKPCSVFPRKGFPYDWSNCATSTQWSKSLTRYWEPQWLSKVLKIPATLQQGSPRGGESCSRALTGAEGSVPVLPCCEQSFARAPWGRWSCARTSPGWKEPCQDCMGQGELFQDSPRGHSCAKPPPTPRGEAAELGLF